MKSSSKPRGAKFWPALGFAALAGSRATSGPAFLSQFLSQQALAPALAGSPLRFLGKPGVSTALKFLIAGEFVGDKLPNTPNRIVPQQLGTRAASGALVGATVYKTKGGSLVTGALVGALGAVAATYLTFTCARPLARKPIPTQASLGRVKMRWCWAWARRWPKARSSSPGSQSPGYSTISTG